MNAQAAQLLSVPVFRALPEPVAPGRYVRRGAALVVRVAEASRESHAPASDAPAPEDAAWADQWIGRVLRERYEIRKHMASGGMGHVFLAEHRLLGRHVALKLLAPTDDKKLVRAFLREARALAGLEHPNIVQVSDLGRLHDGTHYLVMELLRGVPLSRWIEQNGAMSAFRALHILRKLASALDHCHARGVVHRDVKPDNVMLRLDDDEDITLIDFGIAYRPDKGVPDEERGLIVGTPLYMAPEQAFALECSGASDIYSLGALTLELLTGAPAYDLGTAESVVVALRNGLPPRLPSQLGLRVPGLDAIVHKALAHHPHNRYASATAFIDVLERVLEAAPEAALATPRRRRSEHAQSEQMRSEQTDSDPRATTQRTQASEPTLRLRLHEESGVRRRPRKSKRSSEPRIRVASRPRPLISHWQFWAFYGVVAAAWLAMA